MLEENVKIKRSRKIAFRISLEDDQNDRGNVKFMDSDR